jgi:hypothetical protein
VTQPSTNELNTASARRSILKSLRLVNSWMRDTVSVWNPHQTGGYDIMAERYDPTMPMPTADLPEHRVDDLESLIVTMESVTRVATSIREVALAMRDRIQRGLDPDSTFELTCGCTAAEVRKTGAHTDECAFRPEPTGAPQ